MPRYLVWLGFALFNVVAWSQERTLPTDLRQHNLTHLNASLHNASYALDWNRPNSFTIWSRWQWQDIDGDPTTLFLNYTQKINAHSAAGVGFLQHNTGTYLNTGLNLNYVHAFQLESNIKIFVGANVFGFREKLADDRFTPDPDIELPELENTDDFIMLFSPALRLQVDQFNLGLALEGVADFNLSDSERGRGDGGTVVMGSVSNDFPVNLFNGGGNSFVRPMVYVRTIPDDDTQFGIISLLSTSKFWVQGGYNSFYGISGGVGVTIAKQFSIGGLVEVGLDDMIKDEKSTLELVISYHASSTDDRKKVVEFDWEKDDALAYARIQAEEEQRQLEEQKKSDAELIAIREQQREDSIAAAKLVETKKVEEQKLQDSIAKMEARRIALKEQQSKDSIAAAAKERARILSEQKRQDSIAKVREREEVVVQPNEKYEEVESAGGLEPGFYLIANVFGTKKYYEIFMVSLKKKGLEPKSFYREVNKYRYVYLKRYNTMDEARKARDSQFNGRYKEKTWVFRVRGN